MDGLNNDFQKSGMATMLENQARQLISENSATGGGAGGATAGTAGSEEWSGVALPLVRRIFGEIASQEFVSVQPMNLPSGLVFYLDFKYGKTTAGSSAEGFGTGNSFNVPGGDVNSLGGRTGPNSPSGSSAPYGVGGLYGEGRYDYSINSANSIALTLDPANATAKYTTGSVSYKDVNFNQEFSSSLSDISKVTVSNVDLINGDLKAIRSFNITGSAGFDASLLHLIPQFSKDNGDGTSTFLVSGSIAVVANGFVAANTLKIVYSKQPVEADRGDFEDTEGDATNDSLGIPEVDLQLRSSAIVAKTRKLKAVWTPELAQDLNAYHSVDAEAELTSMLSEYISLEIDLEILDMLQADAVTQDYWSVTPGEDYNGSGATEDAWNYYNILRYSFRMVSNSFR